MMDGMKPCVDCDRPVMRGRGRRCAACGSRSDRARMVEWLAGRDPYLVALDDSKFCARLDRRIAAESVFDPKTGCRLWRGATNGYGYGQINFRGVLLGVPRLVAIRAERAKPEDPETRHSCDTPACIAPEHLVGGTPAKNARDRAVRNRSPLPNSGLRGVTFVADGRPNPWQAHVCVAGKGHYMGSFADPEMAAARVLGARKCLGLGT